MVIQARPGLKVHISTFISDWQRLGLPAPADMALIGYFENGRYAVWCRMRSKIS